MADTENRTDDIIEIEDEDAMIVTLEYDDGSVMETEAMGVFEADGKEYIALIPDDGSDDVYIYGYEEVNDEEFKLLDIEDDDEFKRAVVAFDKIIASEE
jgi:hypothetical protein